MSILKYLGLDNKRKITAVFAGIVFHTNYQLKAGIQNDNAFNYQYRNWLFGFTLAPSLLLPVI